MTLDDYNAHCRSLGLTTHVVQWGGSHVWKVAGKLFAVASQSDREPDADPYVTFKTSEMSYDLLKDAPGCRPAPYLASRGMKWIQRTGPQTLDDSANRREILPVAFLAVDEMLKVAKRILSGMVIGHEAAARNFGRFGVFSAVERVLMAAAKAGADRQVMHELLRQESLAAWKAISAGLPNPLIDSLANNPTLNAYLGPEAIRTLLDATAHLGDAAPRARQFAFTIAQTLKDN